MHTPATMSNTNGIEEATNGIEMVQLTEEQQRYIKEQISQELLSNPEFIERCRNAGQQQPEVPNPDEQWSKLYSIQKMKSKVTSFNPANSENILDFLEKLYDDIYGSAKNLCNWDLESRPITGVQYIELIKLKLDVLCLVDLSA